MGRRRDGVVIQPAASRTEVVSLGKTGSQEACTATAVSVCSVTALPRLRIVNACTTMVSVGCYELINPGRLRPILVEACYCPLPCPGTPSTERNRLQSVGNCSKAHPRALQGPDRVARRWLVTNPCFSADQPRITSTGSPCCGGATERFRK